MHLVDALSKAILFNQSYTFCICAFPLGIKHINQNKLKDPCYKAKGGI